MAATGSHLERRSSSDAPSALGPESGSYRAAYTFVAMASNACHILEAALERMDDIIAGKSYFTRYLKNTTASLVIAGLHRYEKCGLRGIQRKTIEEA